MNVKLFSAGIGINNKVPAHRLKYDAQSGVAALEDAMDVLIGRSGDITTRRGTVKEQEGSFHSMFKVDGGFLVVKDRDIDSALYKAFVQVDGTLQLTGITDLALGKHLSYEQQDGKVYYISASNRGVLDSVVASSWPVQEWTGGDTNADMVQMPYGDLMTILSGRSIVASGKEIVYSEYGLLNLTDSARNRRRYHSAIQMIKSVQTGLYVSDSESVYFLEGRNPEQWTSKKVLDYPAIRHGCLYDLVNPKLLGFESTELSCLFATVKGPCIGFPDGTVINLIEDSVTMPIDCGAMSGAIMVVDETTVIQSRI